MSKVSDAIEYLSKRKASIACKGKNGLRAMLEELGFQDDEGDSPNHRVFTHPALSSFTDFATTSVNCGHQQAKPMLLPYILNILRVLRKYQDDFETLEKQQNDQS